MVLNKKGELPWWLILFVLAILVLAVVAPFGARTIFGGRDTIVTLDPQASSLSIDACRNYCEALNGDVSIYTADSARSNYCGKPLKFRDENNKQISKTCLEMAEDPYVIDCRALASCA